ncbi:MAG: hypothetical protein LBI86_01545 [Treponema sp.]|nr:hypothetical protein [Treponema sp.]
MHEASTVPYTGNEPSTNPAVAQLSGDLALWFLQKQVALTNVKVGNPTSSGIVDANPLSSSVATNVIFEGTNWKYRKFDNVTLNGVVTFNGDLPIGSLSQGTNLWLVIGADTSSSKAIQDIEVLELGEHATNIGNLNYSGTPPNDVKLYKTAQRSSLDGGMMGTVAWWLCNNSMEYKLISGSQTINSVSFNSNAHDVYNSKQDFAVAVYAGRTPNRVSQSESSVPKWNTGTDTYVP